MSISSKATGLRPGVCTSTTRPTSPYTGMIIYETDTGYLRVWDGSAWDYLSQSQDSWNLPRGLVTTTSGGTNNLGYRSTLASTTVNAGTTADVANTSMTFTGVSGRLYKYSAGGYAASTSASGVATIRVKDGTTTVQESYINITNSLGGAQFTVGYVFTTSTSKTLKLEVVSNSGNTLIGGSLNYGYTLLEDIGPA